LTTEEQDTIEIADLGLGEYEQTGADFIKTFYTGDKKSSKIVLDNCSVPVLILGGQKIDTDRAILELVHDAMDAGATGITMGGNIWRHANIGGITTALSEIIHNDTSVESAYRLIQSSVSTG
jgi:DhnA family fructose-bisphosphate aldolase class Ia